MDQPGATRFVLSVLVTLALAMAGCVAGGTSAEVEFEGTEEGTQKDSAECDDEGTLTVTGVVDDGSLVVSVFDDQEKQAYHQELAGGLEIDAETVTGEPGTWELEVTRGPDFNGHYVARLGC